MRLEIPEKTRKKVILHLSFIFTLLMGMFVGTGNHVVHAGTVSGKVLHYFGVFNNSKTAVTYIFSKDGQVHTVSNTSQIPADARWATLSGTNVYSGDTLHLSEVELKVKKTSKLVLTAHYPNGFEEDITAKASWSSEDKSIATVKKGVITGKAKGTTVITAKYGEEELNVTVTVTK
ncbi:hypothetical protein ACQCN2_00755 [Brevibacillus ginsengisoli]|uniref:hypothetical protein n=1 Tax=Brevibacillus ginsengisoli TaxID=363854 RepID=UPI003CF493E0